MIFEYVLLQLDVILQRLRQSLRRTVQIVISASHRIHIGKDHRFQGIDQRFDVMNKSFAVIDARFDKQDIDAEDNFRSIGLKLDVFNDNLLELRANHRYFERKLAKIEAHVFPDVPN